MSSGVTFPFLRQVGSLWTPEEDLILLRHVAVHGTKYWGFLQTAGVLPHRDQKACCNRFILLKKRHFLERDMRSSGASHSHHTGDFHAPPDGGDSGAISLTRTSTWSRNLQAAQSVGEIGGIGPAASSSNSRLMSWAATAGLKLDGELRRCRQEGRLEASLPVVGGSGVGQKREATSEMYAARGVGDLSGGVTSYFPTVPRSVRPRHDAQVQSARAAPATPYPPFSSASSFSAYPSPPAAISKPPSARASAPAFPSLAVSTPALSPSFAGSCSGLSATRPTRHMHPPPPYSAYSPVRAPSSGDLRALRCFSGRTLSARGGPAATSAATVKPAVAAPAAQAAGVGGADGAGRGSSLVVPVSGLLAEVDKDDASTVQRVPTGRKGSSRLQEQVVPGSARHWQQRGGRQAQAQTKVQARGEAHATRHSMMPAAAAAAATGLETSAASVASQEASRLGGASSSLSPSSAAAAAAAGAAGPSPNVVLQTGDQYPTAAAASPLGDLFDWHADSSLQHLLDSLQDGSDAGDVLGLNGRDQPPTTAAAAGVAAAGGAAGVGASSAAIAVEEEGVPSHAGPAVDSPLADVVSASAAPAGLLMEKKAPPETRGEADMALKDITDLLVPSWCPPEAKATPPSTPSHAREQPSEGGVLQLQRLEQMVQSQQLFNTSAGTDALPLNDVWRSWQHIHGCDPPPAMYGMLPPLPTRASTAPRVQHILSARQSLPCSPTSYDSAAALTSPQQAAIVPPSFRFSSRRREERMVKAPSFSTRPDQLFEEMAGARTSLYATSTEGSGDELMLVVPTFFSCT